VIVSVIVGEALTFIQVYRNTGNWRLVTSCAIGGVAIGALNGTLTAIGDLRGIILSGIVQIAGSLWPNACINAARSR